MMKQMKAEDDPFEVVFLGRDLHGTCKIYNPVAFRFHVNSFQDVTLGAKGTKRRWSSQENPWITAS